MKGREGLHTALLILCVGHGDLGALADLTPANQTPVLLKAATECNLLSSLRTEQPNKKYRYNPSLHAQVKRTSVHTGWVSSILARSFLTAITRPPVESEPMLTIRVSPLVSLATCTSKEIVKSKNRKHQHTRQTNLGSLLVALGAHTQQTAQKEERNLQHNEDLGKLALVPKHLSDQTISATERGIHHRTNTCMHSTNQKDV